MPLELPPFKIFLPKRLKRLEEQLVRDERSVEVFFDTHRIEMAIGKLRAGEPLGRKDLKILCFHLSTLLSEGLLDSFLVQLGGFFNGSSRFSGHIKGLLVSYYDLFKNEAVFSILKQALSNTSDNRDYIRTIAALVARSSNCGAFLMNMYQEFLKTDSLAEIEQLSEQYLLGKNKNLYSEVIKLMIAKQLQDINTVDSANYAVELMDEINNINVLKPLFENYLLLFENVQYFDNQPEYVNMLFEYIGEQMGDPHSVGRARWISLSPTAIDIYTLWKTQKNIHHFFGDIAGDYSRLMFWKKYSHYFLRVEYFASYSYAILMESKKHLFVEFVGGSGAMYMYSREIQSIDQVSNYQERYSNTQSIQKLKNRYISTERLIHSGYWQGSFSDKLAAYGYRARG